MSLVEVAQIIHCFQVKLEFGNFGSCGGRETKVPGEKPLEQTRTNNNLNPDMHGINTDNQTPGHTGGRPGLSVHSSSNPRPHWWEARALCPLLIKPQATLVGGQGSLPTAHQTPGHTGGRPGLSVHCSIPVPLFFVWFSIYLTDSKS